MRTLAWLVTAALILTILPAPVAFADSVVGYGYNGNTYHTAVVLPNGNHLAYDHGTRTIYERLPGGTILRSVGLPAGYFYPPQGPLQLLENDDLLLALRTHVVQLTWTGEVVWYWAAGNGSIYEAIRLADGSHLLRIDSVAHRVDLSGSIVWTGGAYSIARSERGFWTGQSVVTDHRLQDNEPVLSFLPQGASWIRSVATGADGGVVVVDCCADKIREYNANGTVVWTATRGGAYQTPEGTFERAGLATPSLLYYTVTNERYMFKAERSLPDLAIESFAPTRLGASDDCGGCVELAVTLRNVGDLPTPSAGHITIEATDGLVTREIAELAAPGGIPAGDAVLLDVLWDPEGLTGAWTLTARVDPDRTILEHDEVNNLASTTLALTPLTTIQLSGAMGERTWFLSEVTVNVSVRSARPTTTWCALDEGAPSPCGTISSEGAHELHVWSVDDLGNMEPVQTLAVKVDTHAPRFEIAVSGTPGDAGWMTSAATFDATAVDAASGIALSACATPAGPVASGTVLQDGVHAVTCTASDLAGNVGVADAEVRVDTIAPETTFDTSAVYGPASPPVLLVDDGTSGPAASWASVGGEAAREGATVDLEGVPSGEHALHYWSSDVAGNTEDPRSASLRVDADPPVATLRGAEPGAFVTPAGTLRTDGDHDGFADAVELALGTDPQDRGSAPTLPTASGSGSASLDGTSTQTRMEGEGCAPRSDVSPGFTPEGSASAQFGCYADGVATGFVLLGATVDGRLDAEDPVVANVSTSVARRTLTIDGAPWPMDEDGNFSWSTADARPGRHTIAWTAEDAVGNVASGARDVYVLSPTSGAFEATLAAMPSEPIRFGADEDGDGLPADVSAWDGADGDVSLGLDVDDADPRAPAPTLEPTLDAQRDPTHGGASAGVGVAIVWDDERGVLVEREVVGPFPVLVPGVPDPLPRLRDADDDGIPRIWLKLYDVTVHADGSLTRTNERDVDTGVGDPDG